MLGNQLKKPAKPRETVLIGFLIVAMSYAIFTYFISPVAEQVSLFEEKLTTVEQEVEAVSKFNEILQKNQQEHLKAVKTVSSAVSAQDARVQLIRRTKKQKYNLITDFLQGVTTPGFLSTVRIDSLKYETAVFLPGYTETGFYMVLRGRFPRVMQYIKNLETVEALVTLEQVELSVNPDDSSSIVLKLKGTFYKLDDETV